MDLCGDFIYYKRNYMNYYSRINNEQAIKFCVLLEKNIQSKRLSEALEKILRSGMSRKTDHIIL